MSIRNPLYLDQKLVKRICDGLYAIQLRIRRYTNDEPQHAWRETQFSDNGKGATVADIMAEKEYRNFLVQELSALGITVSATGEESLTVIDPDQNNATVGCLIDPIDGTELARRRIFEWSSAIVVFKREPPEILGCFLVVPERGVYFAVNYCEGAYVYEVAGTKLALTPRALTGPTGTIVRLDQGAHISAYGQKLANLELFTHLLKDRTLGRIYNLAGPTFFTRLVDGHHTEQVHAVLELKGQQLHDAVPGLFLALKAGAVAYDVGDGTWLDDRGLASRLVQEPNSRLRYVAGVTRALVQDILGLSSDGDKAREVV